jgi:alpha-L-rhamnosidase
VIDWSVSKKYGRKKLDVKKLDVKKLDMKKLDVKKLDVKKLDVKKLWRWIGCLLLIVAGGAVQMQLQAHAQASDADASHADGQNAGGQVRSSSAHRPGAHRLGAYGEAMKPFALTVNGRAGVLGVGSGAGVSPIVFGWQLRPVDHAAKNLVQTGYRIVVASSAALLARHQGDVWDSGLVRSGRYWQIAYGGPRLRSATRYFWQVQVLGAGRQSSLAQTQTQMQMQTQTQTQTQTKIEETGFTQTGSWSGAAEFTTALLEAEDWRAHWIAATADGAAVNPGAALPVFRDEFTVEKPVARALLFVSGLGQNAVKLDGRTVTATVLNPGWTDYRKTVLYNTYDVTAALQAGKPGRAHALGVELGNGMYNVQPTPGRYAKFTGSFGQPKLLLQLVMRFTDGSTRTVVSDNHWKTHAGPVTFSSTFGGEDEDARALPEGWARAGFAADGWVPALVVAGPGGVLRAQQAPPMVVAQVYRPVRVTRPKPGVTVYDLGETMSGWPAITVSGSAGSMVRMLPGELLNPDGTVTQRSANAFANDPVLFDYTLRGAGAAESWHPQFAYYSFRYVEVTTEPARAGGRAPRVLGLTGEFVHDDVATVGTFHSADELYNRIHTLIDRAVLSNLASIVTDCPSREKLGWLEQTYLNASTLMLNYDVTGLYEKMSRDIADAQLADGLVPSIAPEYVPFVDEQGRNTSFRDSPEWGSAAILSPWELYRWTGDEEPLRANYGVMQRYAAYLAGRAKGGLLSYGLGDWYDIGPGAPGESQLTSRTATASGVWYEDLTAMAQVATLLGHAEDAGGYRKQAAAVRSAYNAKLFDPGTNEYDADHRGRSQTANAMPLALGMVPAGHEAAVLANLVADIRAHQDHVTAGDVGFHYVVRALTDFGRSDVLAAMLARTDAPSYGYQLRQGATTLTEAWDANRDSSQNHFMLGHGEEWFYRGLAGIAVDMARGPAEAIVLRPGLLAGVGSAAASYRSPMGEIELAWQRTGARARVELTIPAGAQAHVVLPMAAWQMGAKKVASGGCLIADGAEHLAESADSRGECMVLGSGHYVLTTNGL